MNEATKVIHHRGGEGKLLCGKALPEKGRELTSWPRPRRLCRRCFG